MLRRVVLAVCVVAILCGSALADSLPPPDYHLFPKPKYIFVPNPKRPAKVALTIEPAESSGKYTCLQLPGSLVVQQRTEGPPSNTDKDSRLAGPSRISVIVAGAALAIGFAACGLLVGPIREAAHLAGGRDSHDWRWRQRLGRLLVRLEPTASRPLLGHWIDDSAAQQYPGRRRVGGHRRK